MALIALGSYLVWEQHSGVAARMTVTECHTSTGSTSHRRHGMHRSRRSDNCFGVVVNQPRTYQNSMKIWGVHRSDIGHDVDVRIHGREAVANAWSVPLVILGIGGALGVGLLLYAVFRRRRPAGQQWSEPSGWGPTT
jgi:hypothetical protein